MIVASAIDYLIKWIIEYENEATTTTITNYSNYSKEFIRYYLEQANEELKWR